MIRLLIAIKNIFIIPELKVAYTPLVIRKRIYKMNKIPNNLIK